MKMKNLYELANHSTFRVFTSDKMRYGKIFISANFWKMLSLFGRGQVPLEEINQKKENPRQGRQRKC